ncbi:DUF1793-domain-containing protein [Xylariomycetidae sp. FL2044]|nr:DUF1793-domain-containing protein [Xylariomycetidae sp. FL2044]
MPWSSSFNLPLSMLQGDPSGPIYSPVRPPAVPLAVRSPYTSAWSQTSSSNTLSSKQPIFWSGDSVGWEGIVTVDGNAYEYMGHIVQDVPSLPYFNSSTPRTIKFDSQYSNFTFTAGPVTITASFFSPVTPKDICRTSIPLSYLTTSVQSDDGQPHNVQFYSDGLLNYNDLYYDLQRNTAPANGTGNATASADDLYTWLLQRKADISLGEVSDFPEWGNFTYTTTPIGSANLTFQSGFATTVRTAFINNRGLNNDVVSSWNGWGNQEPIFAFAHDVGLVTQASIRYTIGSIQTPMIRYLHEGGVSNLAPWWEQCYGDMNQMIHFHWDDFDDVSRLGNAFEAQLKTDVNAFYQGSEAPVSRISPAVPTKGTDQYGHVYEFDPDSAYGFLDPINGTGIAIPFVSEAEAYYAIVALSARQVMGAYAYAVPPQEANSTIHRSTSEPLIFQKEISSNGNVNTVDVLYPASPFFLYANPELLRMMLQPLYEFQEDEFYPNGYSIHDIGDRFPNATGHVEGLDEAMPVEESGNMILMSYAYYKFTGNIEWLRSHYELLKQFAQYLIEFSLVPATQLSTDDFAGALQNQTNLALKGIVGLQAMSHIARLAGGGPNNDDDAVYFSTAARAYYARWEELGIDPSGRHTTLGYQWRSSWGLLYNVFFDKLLNLGLVDPAVYAMQSEWYASVSQVFGVPLDSRSHQTKSDWEMWAAAGASAETRRLLVDALAYWLNNTVTGFPFGDLYETIADGDYPNERPFKARPVVGGHFAMLALGKTGQLASAAAGDTTGSLFPKNGTDPLPIPDTPIGPLTYSNSTGWARKETKRRTTVLASNHQKPHKRVHGFNQVY